MRILVSGLALFLLACAPEPPRQQESEAPTRIGQATTQGLDAALVAQTLDAARALPRLRSLLVLRDGETLVAERFNDGPSLDTPVNIKSASKTILATIAGIAIARGVLEGVDQPVATVLRGSFPADPDPRLERLTLGHLLSMRAGLERTSGGNYGAWVASPDWVRYALGQPFVAEPGGRMLYSTGSSHLVSAMLTRASDRSTLALARDWLGEPLGIAIPAWPTDPQGIYFGGNDMRLSPRALATFGEMIRNEGRHEGRQVVPADWIARSWEVRTRSPWSGNGYGYGWFAKRSNGVPVHFAWGYGGQMLFVVPELRLTVVMTSDPSPHPRGESHVADLQALLDEGIVPAALRGRQSPSATADQ